MTKLHELLAAEKTPNAAWNQLLADTAKKFKNPSHYFDGHTKSLAMIEDSPANTNTQQQAAENKPVITTVLDTLQYALEIYASAEDLQFQKNTANQTATGTVMWEGEPLLVDMPIDQLLGLEARLLKIRQLFAEIPTLDATKNWVVDLSGSNVWKTEHPEVTTKTEKQHTPVILSEATKEHPANVQVAHKDVVVGKFTTVRFCGSVTAHQKAKSLKNIDTFLVEIKQARMRANEAVVTKDRVSELILSVLLEPFK